jgi:hypothetical protein
MHWSGGESQEQQPQPGALPPFPRIWIGYLLGVATLIAEMIFVEMHPELTKEALLVPPLYLFLAKFISMIFINGNKPDAARSNRLGGIHRLRGVSSARARIRHASAILVRLASGALSSLSVSVENCTTTGIAAGSTAFLMKLHSKEKKCKEGYAGSCPFA